MNTLHESRIRIFAAIGKERDYQDRKYGRPHDRDLSIGAWLKIVRSELVESIEAGDRNDALAELLQVAAVCIACLEVHGLVERTELGNAGRQTSCWP